MTTTTVYRIAHRHFIYSKTGTNYGPYCSGDMPGNLPYLSSAWGDSDQHPLPYDDGIKLDDECVYGFESIEQLHCWFPQDELDELYDYNFVMQVWEIPAHGVTYGARQVAFRHKEGKIVNIVTLDNNLFVPY